MSIESALAGLQAAVEANTAALLNIGKAAAAKGGTVAATASDKKVVADKPKTPKAKTDEEMRAAAGGYLSTGDAAGKEERKTNLKAILAHYEVGLVTELPAEKREAALADIKAFADGGKPSWAEGEDGDEGEEDMLG